MIAPGRFWTDVSVAPVAGGFGVRLDDRPLRTPAKAELVAPTRALAEAVADEWRAVEGRIDPTAMPVTRAVNVAIDRVDDAREAVIDAIAAYGETDLLCYRAEGPEGLRLRQQEGWDPALDWAEAELGAPLLRIEGVMHFAQPPASVAALRAAVAEMGPLELTALNDLVGLSGSLVLGLAVARGARRADEAWTLSRIDETWQAEVWGLDAEAEAAAERRRLDFMRAARLLDLLAN